MDKFRPKQRNKKSSFSLYERGLIPKNDLIHFLPSKLSKIDIRGSVATSLFFFFAYHKNHSNSTRYPILTLVHPHNPKKKAKELPQKPFIYFRHRYADFEIHLFILFLN